MSFQIRDLIWFTVVVAVHFALRRLTYAFGDELRSEYVPLVLALIACVGWMAFRRPQPSVIASVVLGFVASFLSSLQLMIEIGNDLQSNSTYWQWSKDWPLAAGIVATLSVLGSIIGLAASLGRWLVPQDE